MEIHIAISGAGHIIAIGTDQDAVRLTAEKEVEHCASEIRWVDDWRGLRREYLMADTARWNKIPEALLSTQTIKVPGETNEDIDADGTECIDADGNEYPEHNYGLFECARCGAEAAWSEPTEIEP